MFSKLWRNLTVRYNPHPEDQAFRERACEQEHDGLTVTVAVMSDRESRRYFGVALAHRGLQPVWIRAKNASDQAYRLDFFSLDAAYYTPLEAAYICHFSVGRRLLSFGGLAWLFLPLLPLIPLKLFGAWAANRRIDALFKKESFRFGPIQPQTERCGVVFTTLDEGHKNVEIDFVAQLRTSRFTYSLDVPGLDVLEVDQPSAEPPLREASEVDLKDWIRGFARCTTNKSGGREGDPLNLVVIGDRAGIRRSFGGRWDETEAITLFDLPEDGPCFSVRRRVSLFSGKLPVRGRTNAGHGAGKGPRQHLRADPSSSLENGPGLSGATGVDWAGESRYRRAVHAQDLELDDAPHRPGR